MTVAVPRRRRERALRASQLAACALAAIAVGGFQPAPAAAQESWNPFSDRPPPGARPARPRPAEARPAVNEPSGGSFGQDAPAPGGTNPVQGAGPSGPSGVVERIDLAPLPAPEGAVAPPVAREGGGQPQPPPNTRPAVAGTDSSAIPALTRLSKETEFPLRSPALSALLVRIAGPRGIASAETIEALGLRAGLLYRAGQLDAAAEIVGGGGEPPASSPAAAAFSALSTRIAMGLGDRERVCAGAVALMQARAELPASLKAEGIVAQGYCGAAGGNPGAAGLAASLGREIGGVPEATLAALDAVGAGEAPAYGSGQRLGVTEWRLAELSGKLDTMSIAPDRLDPAALNAASRSATTPPRLRIVMAEAAARQHVISAATLAEAYRQASFAAADLAQPFSAKVEPWARRALMQKAAEAERTPIKRARVIRAALDDARRVGLFTPVAAALAPSAEEIRAVPEVGWFAETAVEVLLAAGRLEPARRWAEFGSQPGVTADRTALSLAHWIALIDIADPQQKGGRSQSLAQVEDLALRGRFSPDGLHRLATVLDALDFQVPVRLWEAASRSPQPTTGHLPPTGVLAELQDAAKRKELIRTATLVFRTLGPAGPEGAHMIALGDAIRALRRAGLEVEARAVAAEALFPLWPRASSS